VSSAYRWCGWRQVACEKNGIKVLFYRILTMVYDYGKKVQKFYEFIYSGSLRSHDTDRERFFKRFAKERRLITN
jgi:hypothetical protein